MVSATGGSPQIIQTHSGSQMTTTMAGAGGNDSLDLEILLTKFSLALLIIKILHNLSSIT